jgi:hypothetical protein
MPCLLNLLLLLIWTIYERLGTEFHDGNSFNGRMDAVALAFGNTSILPWQQGRRAAWNSKKFRFCVVYLCVFNALECLKHCY